MKEDEKLDGGGELKPKSQPTEKNVTTNFDQSKEKFESKLSQDEIVDRFLETGQLFKLTEDRVKLAQELKEKRKREEDQLLIGIRRAGENYSLTDFAQPYISFFGNDVPFFSEMFRVADIDADYDPNVFGKPPIAGVLVNELIYRRFGRQIVDVLRARAIPNGDRRYKFSQFLDLESKTKIIQFRDEAILMMKKYGRGQLYEMRYDYASTYNTGGFQFRMDL